ncbi:unnamed protein product [Sphenostylis stenocarpa]|uniref:Uncharacterized protein n=1 Tax=Sphenostylis stenocarpa TaxID=92480 RepID=A0AA86V3N9_9FABA|nr:unnamed protein product [Sphenostylis stenocarpa]
MCRKKRVHIDDLCTTSPNEKSLLLQFIAAILCTFSFTGQNVAFQKGPFLRQNHAFPTPTRIIGPLLPLGKGEEEKFKDVGAVGAVKAWHVEGRVWMWIREGKEEAVWRMGRVE